ncbi:MAG: glycosyltransferase [bacterium]|nr:glycosyltransferase [bacterium]
MSLFFIPAFLLLFVYGVILLWLARGFSKTSCEKFTGAANLPLTLIVCARNEEKSIATCIRGILQQDYALQFIQFILVNDASTDATRLLAEKELQQSGIDYTILNNSEHLGKKKSITSAISLAKHELLVMRDADTFTASSNWLSSLVTFYLHHTSDLIIAPLKLADASGVLWALQAIENNVLSLMAAGSAYYQKPFLCNGANMAFKKSVFQKVGGFARHAQIPSGDDVLFMEDVKKIAGSKIDYLKCEESIVSTYSQTSFGPLLRQKVRWASKFKSNQNKLNRLLALLSVLVNVFFLIALWQLLMGTGAQRESALFVVFKLVIDFLLLFLASSSIKNKHVWWYVIPISFLYPFYAGIIALLSVIATPKWNR